MKDRNERSECAKQLSLAQLGEFIFALRNGKGAALDVLGKMGSRLIIDFLILKPMITPIHIFTHPSDIRTVWKENKHKLDKAGRFYDTLRRFSGIGLFNIKRGDEWKKKRILVGENLSPHRIPALKQNIHTLAKAAIEENISKYNEKSMIEDIHKILKLLIFQITTKTLFGKDFSNEEVLDATTALTSFVEFITNSAIYLGIPEYIYRHIPFYAQKFRQAELTLQKISQRIINEYREGDSPLLDLLIKAGLNKKT